MIHARAQFCSKRVWLLPLALAWVLTTPSSAQMDSNGRTNVQKVILDTDIGGDVDDAYALGRASVPRPGDG